MGVWLLLDGSNVLYVSLVGKYCSILKKKHCKVGSGVCSCEKANKKHHWDFPVISVSKENRASKSSSHRLGFRNFSPLKFPAFVLVSTNCWPDIEAVMLSICNFHVLVAVYCPQLPLTYICKILLFSAFNCACKCCCKLTDMFTWHLRRQGCQATLYMM